MKHSILVLALLVGVSGSADASAPSLGNPQIQAVPHPFDEGADAAQAIQTAFAAAKRSGKRVLIDFGANWCPDCRVLSGVLVGPAKAWADQHFEIVMVDVGRMNKNLDIAERYGLKVTGIPAVVVATPDGKVVNGDDMLPLTSARDLSAQAIVDVLARWCD